MWPALRTPLPAVPHRCPRPCAIRAATRAPLPKCRASPTCGRALWFPLARSLSRGNTSQAGQESGVRAPGARAAPTAPVFAQLLRSPGAAPHKAPADPQPPPPPGGRGATPGQVPRGDTRGRSPLLPAPPGRAQFGFAFMDSSNYHLSATAIDASACSRCPSPAD
ncbi:sterile alpha motif domain-containing protein 1-like [Pseudopipra pipra]|uniref:sterile alpha motif domain-containing protein 1-like n=1 Tax=Pseudopipra pipra TaxID=415032 RepID=UPI00313861E2